MAGQGRLNLQAPCFRTAYLVDYNDTRTGTVHTYVPGKWDSDRKILPEISPAPEMNSFN